MKFQHFNAPTNREIYNQWTRFYARLPRIFVVGSSRVLRVSSTPHRVSSRKENRGRNNPTKDDRVSKTSTSEWLCWFKYMHRSWSAVTKTIRALTNGVDKRKCPLTGGNSCIKCTPLFMCRPRFAKDKHFSKIQFSTFPELGRRLISDYRRSILIDTVIISHFIILYYYIKIIHQWNI